MIPFMICMLSAITMED